MMKRKVVKKVAMTENQEQILLATWLTKKGIKFYAIPNGGKRNALEAFNFKRCGVQSGIPDICIPIPSGSHHGLYIELKRKSGGRLSDNQVYWLNYLRGNGYYAEVAKGFDEAVEIINHYFSFTKSIA
jgi:hypothetical protein